MNHLLHSALLFCSLATAFAAPVLTTDYNLSPGSQMRIVFDNAMVAKDKLGSHQENNILAIDPVWKGRIVWHSENVAIFQPLEVAPLNTTYTFSTQEGITDLKGDVIKPTQLGKKSTNKFMITRTTKLGTAYRDKHPGIFLHFNDDVSATNLAPYFYYQSSDGNRAAAQVTQATFGEINSTYYAQPSWTKQSQFAINKVLEIANPTEELKAETVLSNSVVVRPIDILPPGKNWQLISMKGVPNLTNNVNQDRSYNYTIGDKLPFQCLKATAITYPNEPRFLRFRFNSYVLKDIPKEQLAEIIKVTPEIPNMTFIVKDDYIDINGDFYKNDTYNVSVQQSLNSQNGLRLTSAFSSKVTFTHIKPSMAIPSFSQAPPSKGQRKYPVETVNMASVKVRVKALTMQQAVIAHQGFNQFLADQTNYERKPNTKRVTLPFSLINGSLVHNQEYPLDNKIDTSKTVVLDWDEILPQERDNLIFFIDIEGSPKPSTKDSLHRVQSIIQLTDIGLAWKQNATETFLYCYSCDTGEPLANVNIQTYSDDATVLDTHYSDRNGIVHIPHANKATHLSATYRTDSYIIPWSREMSHVSLWRFPVKYDYYKFTGWKREALIFTDRQLYKPSEKVRVKGIVRESKDNQHRIPQQRKATLIIQDPADRILLEQEITLSENGSFDQALDLPSSNLGTYQIKLTFEIPKDHLQDEMADHGWEHNWMLRRNSVFTSYFSVQEFRRNAFKIASDVDQLKDKANILTAKVNANYYMGTAVAKGKLNWFLTVSESGFYPEKFRNYYFGNHLDYDPYYWDYYYGYNDGHNYGSQDSQKQNGTLDLTEQGSASFDLTVQPPKFPSPQKVKLISEVTDGREQTLTSSSHFTLHPSSHYIGISRIDSLLRVGQANEISFLAVDKAGNQSKVDFDATVTINRITYDPVKVRAGDGSVTINNNKKEELFSTTEIKLTANDGQPTKLNFSPDKAGRYTVSIESKDAAGNKISSATRIHVYGSKEYPWAVNTGMKIELAPEKKHYKPGENARILVKTPIEGTALVTVERSGIKRYYLRELSTSDPVIEVPIEHQDTPNVYVSVLLIRGASESPLKYKEPALRLGYCNLNVDNEIDKIAIALDTPESSYRPGETVTLSGTLTDYKNQPVSNAEITFYGEDNGVLDVIGYQMPKPLTYFNSPIALAVETGTSLDTFLQEMAAEDMDMINKSLLNKGYTIGGGGDIDDIKQQIRKNFDPCAFWNPTLKTDAQGRFTFTFKTPETLTSYKVMAVAIAGAQKFGSTSSEIVVNKPLMLEPMAPRFANEGDTTRTKLYIANNSEYEGTWKVELKTNSLSAIVGDSENIHPQHGMRTVSLQPGGSAYLDFDVSHLNTGSATWTWSAEPVNIANKELTPKLHAYLSDAMETKFEVHYPRPILKGAKFSKLIANKQDVLRGIDPELFNGRGHIELDFSNNLLSKGKGAAKYLLHYPYGCVEQTTSSLMPWFAVNELKPYIPEFEKQTDKNILKAIQQGADRLLSMQTSDGGLAYWPGGNKSEDWATTYGGYALILAKQHGANVPDEAVNKIANYLNSQVHRLIKKNDSWSLETATRSLHTLSIINKAKQSDLNFIYEQHKQLNSSSRAYLAMAMHQLNPISQEARALVLLDEEDKNEKHWMKYNTHNQSQLLALCQIAPENEMTHQLMDRIVRSTDQRDHWGTTWANSATINAMAAYARAIKDNPLTSEIQLEIDGEVQTITLNTATPMKTISIPLGTNQRILSSSGSLAYCNAVVYSKPLLSKPTATSKNGLAIKKTYHRILKDGTREPLTAPKVGDLVEVELEVTFNNEFNYVVIDDPLPGTFECVNSEFASQSSHVSGKADRNWRVSNQELRDDRALFFLNRSWYGKTDTISYLARITSSGKVTIPAAKVEAMYDPDSYGLSASGSMDCLPRK